MIEGQEGLADGERLKEVNTHSQAKRRLMGDIIAV